jgi:Ca2+-binding RTX toxin-like protein
MSIDDALKLTLAGRSWASPIVTDGSGTALGYSFYTGTWPSYIYSGGTYSSGYTSIVTTSGVGIPPPDTVTTPQQNLIRYYLSDESSSVGGLPNYEFRVSFSDVTPLEFSEEPWSAGNSQIFISRADVTEADAAAATRAPVTVDHFNGDGTNRVFTMSFAPGTESNMEVRVGGVLKHPDTYSISGTTLTFNVGEAPPPGSDNVLVNLNNGYFAGDVVIDLDSTHNTIMTTELGVGDQGAQTILHELAHALGLIHANNASGWPNAGLSDALKKQNYTIMGTSAGFTHPDMTGVYATGLQLFDIAALQSLYGRNYEKRSDDNEYSYGDSGGVIQAFGANAATPFIYTIWDGGGVDLINTIGYGERVEVDLRQGHFSSIGRNGNSTNAVDGDGAVGSADVHGNVAIAYYTVIENAIGTASGDRLIGNAWSNYLLGGGGADAIFGDGRSYDGKAEFTGDDDPFEGNRDIENPWEDSASDQSGNDVLMGGTDNDVLYGGKGDDILHGGFDWYEITEVWSDWDEALQFYPIDPLAHEDDGIDIANYSRLYLNESGVEDIAPPQIGISVDVFDDGHFVVNKGAFAEYGQDYLISIESIVGTAGIDYFVGSNGEGDITLFGGDADDLYESTVNSLLGVGSMTLDGGIGWDKYTFNLSNDLDNSAQDVGYVTIADTTGGIIDIADEAFHNLTVGLGDYDTSILQLVTATTTGGLTITLDRPSIENGDGIGRIILDGLNFDASDLVAWLFGHSPVLHDIAEIAEDIGVGQSGSAAADTLVPYSSMDVLSAGLGNDLYKLGAYTAQVIEQPDEGIDTVEASASYALPDNVENLTLTGSSGINATGNGLANVLAGNSGANTLDGGAGADTMAGGAGGDTYIVDDVGDVITEFAGSGLDKVLSSVSYTLAANVDHLTLTGSLAIDATGNGDTNVLVGNSGSNTLNGAAGADTMAGGAGDDTYVVDNAGDVVTENSGEGTDTVKSSLGSYTLGANLEDLTLTGSSNINGTGNSLVNAITGNSGNNTLDGGSGADTLAGGAGNDVYIVDNTGDVVIEDANEGIDEVRSTVSYTLAANVENLTLDGIAGSISGTGNNLDNILTGSYNTATLAGGAGNDTYFLYGGLIGTVVENDGEGIDKVYAYNYALPTYVENYDGYGVSAFGIGNALDNIMTGATTLDGAGGSDSLTGASGRTLIGGTGDDTFTLDYAGGSNSTIIENSGEGTDLVLTSRIYTLATNIENLTVIGVGAITATGNSGSNVLTGNGAGSTLAGGSGNDTFYVGAGDVVSEGAGGGTDTVYSGLTTYTLTSNVENLVLTGSGNIDGTGNTLGNTITGTSGYNSLDGGTGTDTLIGGDGNDTYLINVTADVVTEGTGGSSGIDTVITSVTGYTLAANVENLVLGGSIVTGTGNGDDNSITGNAAANTLNGGAGADVLDGLGGNDAMNGGLGNDTFYVDSSSDNANENASEGTDTVYASVTYAMNTGSRVNVENLILTGSSNINGTGNSLVNVITANSGNNTLDGGAGADSLIGGSGDDTYIVDDVGDSISESGGTDTIQASLNWTLATDLENLTLSGSSGIHGTGNSGNNTITGNTGANSLSGADGADLLSGGSAVDTLNGGNGNDTLDGGAGNDTMDGGSGDDVYIVDSASDSIADSSGIDTVQSSVTYTLAAGLENLTLTGTTISGIGNSAANYMVGSASVNTLTGLGDNDTLDGGAGADSLVGGTGDDVYYVSVTTENVIELSGEGTDTAIANVTGYVLDAYVENLILSGTVANGSGNGENNVITGNSANNSVSGLLGNDTYMLGSGGNDTINETINGGGTDTLWITGGTTINDVTASTSGNNDIISYNGGSDQVTLTNVNTANSQYYIETIRFDDGFFTTLMDNNTWTSGTSGADTLTGNSSHNVIIGKAGADTLDGAGGDDDIHGGSDNDVLKGGSGTDLLHGGTGNDSLYGQDGLDTMFGGTGLDTFVFEAATAYNNIDVIQDFNVLTDDDVLDLRDLLSGYSPGSHLLTDFVKVEDSGSDSIVSIDRDGTGSTYGWNQVATLKGITGLTDEATLVSGGNLLAA